MIFTNVDRWYYYFGIAKIVCLPTGLYSTELVFELVNLAIMEKSIFKNTYILTTMLTDGRVIRNLKLYVKAISLFKSTFGFSKFHGTPNVGISDHTLRTTGLLQHSQHNPV